MAESQVPFALLSSLLFSMMGPVALFPSFANATSGAEKSLRQKIALLAFAVAFGSLALAVMVGAGAMAAVGTSPSSLIIAAGLILTFTALRNIFGTVAADATASGRVPMTVALVPIAIPGIVTPMGVAILIIFVSYFTSLSDRLAIMAVVAAVMVCNLIAMLSAHWFMRAIGPAPLLVLGAIFGVLQAAMGIEMIVSGLIRSQLFR